MTTNPRILAKANTFNTAQLFAALAALAVLEGKRTLDENERTVKMAMYDVLERRHNLTDKLDAIIGADDFRGTYTDALRAAMATDIAPCEQCGGRDRRSVDTEYGVLCPVCAFRQHEHDENRANFAHLTPSSLGFLSDEE